MNNLSKDAAYIICSYCSFPCFLSKLYHLNKYWSTLAHNRTAWQYVHLDLKHLTQLFCRNHHAQDEKKDQTVDQTVYQHTNTKKHNNKFNRRRGRDFLTSNHPISMRRHVLVHVASLSLSTGVQLIPYHKVLRLYPHVHTLDLGHVEICLRKCLNAMANLTRLSCERLVEWDCSLTRLPKVTWLSVRQIRDSVSLKYIQSVFPNLMSLATRAVLDSPVECKTLQSFHLLKTLIFECYCPNSFRLDWISKIQNLSTLVVQHIDVSFLLDASLFIELPALSSFTVDRGIGGFVRFIVHMTRLVEQQLVRKLRHLLLTGLVSSCQESIVYDLAQLSNYSCSGANQSTSQCTSSSQSTTAQHHLVQSLNAFDLRIVLNCIDQ